MWICDTIHITQQYSKHTHTHIFIIRHYYWFYCVNVGHTASPAYQSRLHATTHDTALKRQTLYNLKFSFPYSFDRLLDYSPVGWTTCSLSLPTTRERYIARSSSLARYPRVSSQSYAFHTPHSFVWPTHWFVHFVIRCCYLLTLKCTSCLLPQTLVLSFI